MMHFLAETMIPGEWLTGIVVAIIGAVGAVLAKQRGKVEGRAETATTIANQPLSIAMTETLATKDELDALERRIVGELKKLESSLNNERSVARTANGNVHARIDKTVEGIAELKGEMKGELHQINANLSRLIDLALGKGKPGTAR